MHAPPAAALPKRGRLLGETTQASPVGPGDRIGPHADHACDVVAATVQVQTPTRRSFLAAVAGLALAGPLPACGVRQGRSQPGERDHREASLVARPGEPTEPFVGSGTHALGLEEERDALLHVPAGLQPGQAVPLVITLHGAGGDAEAGLGLLRSQADERGLLLLAPTSRGSTWDAIRGGYGPDVRLIDRALQHVFRAVAVDGERVAVAGFSDGASYALGLGLANGRLFSRAVAFSPGFVPQARREGAPRIFVSHGTADEVLPIKRTSRRIVPTLRDEGLDVTYREFPGPHTVPDDIAREAVDWLEWDRPG
jgi:phospholipase/carboxylesterase